MNDALFITFQKLAPTNAISRLCGWLADRPLGIVTTKVIEWFIRRYDVKMEEALDPRPSSYKTFNAFFTRALKPGTRPMPDSPVSCISPVDGALYASGPIVEDHIYQAKGKHYTASALLGDTAAATICSQHQFACIYLSPKDYHRIHCPMEATLVRTQFIPGKLYSVNPVTAKNINHLFSTNERLVCHFETSQGPMILVFVGAMVVGSIKTVWSGTIYSQNIQTKEHRIKFSQGDELGCFQLGSTVIMFIPPSVPLIPLKENMTLRLNMALSRPEIKT